MISETLSVQEIFQATRQYCVPFYQRAYVWTLENQWEQLWGDIQEKANARVSRSKVTPHFLGAIVLEPQAREGLKGVDVYHIIDGQQRLTTLQFALAAVLLALKRAGQTEFMSIVSTCSRNGNIETMRKPDVEVFKVWPTFRDRQSYTSALDAQTLDELRVRFPRNFTNSGDLRKIGVVHPASLAALWYFTHRFEEWLKAGPEEIAVRAEAMILSLLRDLKIVTITLQEGDDAQIIFETLNGRGAQLHATDLIRNYVFMRADHDGAKSEMLYDTLWAPFETAYWSTEQRRGRLRKPRMEWLIHTSLQAELHEEVDLARLYFEYRRFATRGSTPTTAENQLITLTEYAKHYRQLVDGEGDTPIAHFGRRISAFDISTLHPLALMIAAADISDEYKREMFGDLVSFLVRRAICDLTTKNYNYVFLTALRQLHEAGVTPSALRQILGNPSGDASRWPDDGEFRAACLSAPLYPARLEPPKTRLILSELEGYLRTTIRGEESVGLALGQLDIDHIMPRSWFTYWPLSDGSPVTQSEVSDADYAVRIGATLSERQSQIVRRQSSIQTLGNLTLLNLSVNREAQHHAFTSKRDLLIANTTLRLNIPLISIPEWNEETIAKRGELLADAALNIWPGPRP